MKHDSRLGWCWIMAVVAGVFLAGCGEKGLDRYEVTGVITFQGKPLDRGNIQFIPADPSLPTQAGTGISAGNYTIPQAQGLVPGKYLVSISSADGETPVEGSNALPGPSGNFASKDRIPAEFNTNSKLEVEVKTDKPNKFDFTVP